MTRKDYVAIAAAVKARVQLVNYETTKQEESASDALIMVAREIADVMANDNPRLDRARFLKACGVQS